MKMGIKNDNAWTFSWTFATSFVLLKTKQKKQGYKKFILVYCGKFVTWNAQVILELVFHIPTLQHPNHIKFEITPN
jgi:hypothetical protein